MVANKAVDTLFWGCVTDVTCPHRLIIMDAAQQAVAMAAQVMEVTGCSREQAESAVEAAGPGGVELAVDFVLSTMNTHFSSAEDLPAPTPMKMVALVRQDLGMGIGKVAAQVSHATLGAYKSARRSAGGDQTLATWEAGGEATIVLKVDDHEQLEQCLQLAEAKGLVTHRVSDAGRTEVAPGTVTVGAIGPGTVTSIDTITGQLSLLT